MVGTLATWYRITIPLRQDFDMGRHLFIIYYIACFTPWLTVKFISMIFSLSTVNGSMKNFGERHRN